MTDKFKAHIRYKTKDGTLVPGVSTIVGELGWSKEILCRWNNKMGLNNIDTSKYVNDKSDIGTLAHLIITNKLQGIETCTDDYSKNQIKDAKNSVKSFDAWALDKKIEPILIEKPLVSEQFNFGGTLDIYGIVDGIYTLIDLKTGKDIYDEHLVQIGGYAILLEEHGHKVEKIIILNIPRAASEKFNIEENANIEVCKKIFLNCLEIYNLKKQIRNNDFYQYIKEVNEND